MKPNVISILVDSVSWDCISTHRSKVSVTPFLDSLRNESITASKLYSQGPYTDAATKSLYTGRNCLDDFAYYSKLNSSPTNHFKVFHENGYETYGFYYPYYMIGSGIKKYIDHSIYTSKFAFVSEWGGIFYYYSDAIKNRNLTDDEYSLLREHFELLFDVWIGFYTDLLFKPGSRLLIKDEIGNFDIKEALSTLEEENEFFQINPRQYIDDFLRQGKEHKLNSLDKIDVDSLISRERIDNLFKQYKSFFNKVETNNLRANCWKNRPRLSRILWSAIRKLKSYDKNSLLFISNFLHHMTTLRSLKKHCKDANWQYLPSARREFEGGITVLEQMEGNKPFYMSFHVLDPHSYINFFSYDMLSDKEVVKEEMNMLSEFVDNLGTDFISDLPYLLSIRYTDYCIENFCNELKERGLWENTILLVFADHGSSFSYYPLHNAPVNCFDDECYHVPMWMRVPGIMGKEVVSYHNAIDMFPTLYDILGFENLYGVKGHSMLDMSVPEKPYVMTEYMGPGCPDLLSRRIWFSIRDKHYLVAYKVGLFEQFENGDLCEVYDLSKDPNAYYNINNRINKCDISYLLSKIEERYNEVRKGTCDYMEQLRNKS